MHKWQTDHKCILYSRLSLPKNNSQFSKELDLKTFFEYLNWKYLLKLFYLVQLRFKTSNTFYSKRCLQRR